MSAFLDKEPNIPTRNLVDAFFIEATTNNSPVSYTLAPVLLAAVVTVIGGTYEEVSEGIRTFNMLVEHNFAEAIRSSLAVLGSGVAIKVGVDVLRSAAYVMKHPLHQKLYNYHANRRAEWKASVRQSVSKDFPRGDY